MDSFLTVAIYQDIQPAVILTKVDLDRGEKLESLYADAGIPVYLVDYDKPETIDNVAKLLDGKISMMTGNSGVGKSTLLNAIAPELQLATGEISESWDEENIPHARCSLSLRRRLSGRHAGLFYLWRWNSIF